VHLASSQKETESLKIKLKNVEKDFKESNKKIKEIKAQMEE